MPFVTDVINNIFLDEYIIGQFEIEPNLIILYQSM